MTAIRKIEVEVGQEYFHTLIFQNADKTPMSVVGRTYAAKIGSNEGVSLLTFNIDMTDAATGKVVLSLSDLATPTLASYIGRQQWKVYENDAPLLEGPCDVTAGMYA